MVPEILARLQSLPWLTAEAGIQAMLLYVGIVVLSQIVIVPVSPFDIAAGFAFGFRRGVLVMLVAKLLSAFVSLNLARSIGKGFAERMSRRFPLLDGLNTAIEKGGWKIAILLRFCPIPFGISHYAFGLTPLTNWHNILASGVAILGPTLVFVSMGASAKSSIYPLDGTNLPQSPWLKVFLLLGIVAALCVFRYISKIAMRSLQEAQLKHATPSNAE